MHLPLPGRGHGSGAPIGRIGILGGTFNPPHIAHLIGAIAAREQLALERVVLIPTGRPPHKDSVGIDPGPEVRLDLCEAAVAGVDGLAVARTELDRPGPSYTVDTLQELHEQAPGSDVTFILGGDMARSLPSWRDPEGILALARLAVVERASDDRAGILDALKALPAAAGRIDFVTMPRLDISSSALRDRIKNNQSVRYFVPDAVAERIHTLGLYQPGVHA